MADIDLGSEENLGGQWLRGGKETKRALREARKAANRVGVMWQVAEPRVVGVSKAYGVTLGEVHLGDCFRQAANFLVNNDAPGARLVHGSVRIGQAKDASGQGIEIAHAWVELSDGGKRVAFDGVQSQFYDLDDYREKMKAVEGASYTREQALVNLLKHRHYGPWERGASLGAAR